MEAGFPERRVLTRCRPNQAANALHTSLSAGFEVCEKRQSEKVSRLIRSFDVQNKRGMPLSDQHIAESVTPAPVDGSPPGVAHPTIIRWWSGVPSFRQVRPPSSRAEEACSVLGSMVSPVAAQTPLNSDIRARDHGASLARRNRAVSDPWPVLVVSHAIDIEL